MCMEDKVARVTGLEPATSGVTGRRSNQLSYTPAKQISSVIRMIVNRTHQPLCQYSFSPSYKKNVIYLKINMT